MTVEETITALEHSLWVVDHAVVTPPVEVTEDGQILPPGNAEPGQSVAELLEQMIRPDRRGVTRVGLSVRLWLALLLVAAYTGRATISQMIDIATGCLPRELQWELGILTWDTRKGKAKVRMLTAKQLYTMAQNITRHLDVDPAMDLTDEQRAQRVAVLNAIKDALVQATHVLPHAGSSYAVDESGVWSWTKGRRKPKGTPEVDPADEDQAKAAEIRKAIADGKISPDFDDVDDHLPDEDADVLSGMEIPAAHAGDPDAATARCNDTVATASRPAESDEPQDAKPKRAPLRCWLASWGVKTHKSGRSSAYHGYALHALIRVPDLVKKGGKTTSDNYAEPLLLEQFELTAASTDVVEVTIGMVKKVLGRGHRVKDLLGDRHYSYKAYTRWLSRLWRLGVRPVVDLRKNDHRVISYNGAEIIAGTPHCGVPAGLRSIARPGRNATKKEWEDYDELIAERQLYAMIRVKTGWDGGDGKTRWTCRARSDSGAGCPRIAGSAQAARADGLPIVRPPEVKLPWCEQRTALIEAGAHMKYQQEEYWGTVDWLISWNRRTYIEGAFGNIKNHNTGNVHRGFFCFVGMPLVTLALTAAVIAYNLRELESWYVRASEEAPDNPLLALYEEHPLHQRTKWQHGFTMLSADTQAELDQQWLTRRNWDEGDEELPLAA